MNIRASRAGICSLVGVTLAIAALSGNTALATVARLDPGSFTSVARVDPRYQSFNIEMAEVIGAKFWKPYANRHSNAPMTKTLGKPSADLFERSPPINLGSSRLRMLAAALGPIFLRVSGTWANKVYFQDNDAPALHKAPPGFHGVLTRKEWRGVVNFAKAVNAKILTSFAISPGVRNGVGLWTPVQARKLLNFTRRIGGSVDAAELFNEPNFASMGGAPTGYDPADFAHDEAAFHHFVATYDPAMKIVGPGTVVVDSPTTKLPMHSLGEEALLSARPRAHYDIFSYHFYGAISQRCAPPGSPLGTSPANALSEAWLSRTDRVFAHQLALRNRFAPRAPIWLTETGDAACGGNPWAATFLDSFRYLDQLASLAQRGLSVLFHNTLVGSDYGLLDERTFTPRPTYWAALIWHRLMGPVVLNPAVREPGLHLYAQCLRGHAGGVAMLALNLDASARNLMIADPSWLYVLSAPGRALETRTILLNGHALALAPGPNLPKITPVRHRSGKLVLPAHSIVFIAVPTANNDRCGRPQGRP